MIFLFHMNINFKLYDIIKKEIVLPFIIFCLIRTRSRIYLYYINIFKAIEMNY